MIKLNTDQKLQTFFNEKKRIDEQYMCATKFQSLYVQQNVLYILKLWGQKLEASVWPLQAGARTLQESGQKGFQIELF